MAARNVYYRNSQDKRLQDHGPGVARAYESWVEMRRRVKHPHGRNSSYAGATIDPRWNDFWTFFADMGERPQGLTLDRINTKILHYGPEFCRWADSTTQGQNARDTKLNLLKAEDIRRRYMTENIS